MLGQWLQQARNLRLQMFDMIQLLDAGVQFFELLFEGLNFIALDICNDELAHQLDGLRQQRVVPLF